MGKAYKVIKTDNIKLDQIYFQYVPGRFEKAFRTTPSVSTLHISQLPHCDLLRKYVDSKSTDLLKTDYYKMHEAWGRNKKWIESRILKFIKLFENVSKNGLRKAIMVLEKPMHKKFHDGYEIYEGHHRTAVYVVLGRESIKSKIIRFT